MKITETFLNDLKNAIPKQMGAAGVFNTGVEGGNVEAMKSINNYNRELGETKKDEDKIKKSIKKSDIIKLVGNKKMKTPTGKIQTMSPIMGEEETTEAMGASGAGGYSTQLFSVKKKDVEEIKSKK